MRAIQARNQAVILASILGLAASASAATEPSGGASVTQLLDRVATAFPAGQYVDPKSFTANADVQHLLLVAEPELGGLLKECQLAKGLWLGVENPFSAEQFKSPRDYEQYLAEWRKRDSARCELEHRRILVSMLVAEAERAKPGLLRLLLSHESPSVRRFALQLLPNRPDLKRDEIVQALLSMVPKSLPSAESWKRGITMEDEIAADLARVLSNWQVREALSYIRMLGKHPFYHTRSESLLLMNRFGFREAIPHSISLLEDEVDVTRGAAFTNLVKLTALDFGQPWELWGEKSRAEERAAAAETWRAWWASYRKPDDDAAFHAEVIERILRLMERSPPPGSPKEAPIRPENLLEGHLSISSLGQFSRDPAERVAQFRRAWTEHRKDIRFDPRWQMFVMERPRKTD
jgi:hypothetical protein